MKTILALSLCILFVTHGASYGACTSQDIKNLKAADYTQAEIDSICPVCSPQDYIKFAQAEKTKTEITTICSSRAHRDVAEREIASKDPNRERDLTPYKLLVGKAFTIGFDAYHTNKTLKKSDDDGLAKSSSGEELFKAYLKYTLPVSSMAYAFNENRPEKPHPLLKAFKLYAEGNFSNAIKADDGSSGLSIKTEDVLYYNAGIKFETDFDTLFSNGKNYKYYSNY